MQEEIPNNNTGWRKKIAGLEALPGYPSTDFGEAWEKLQLKLSGEKTGTRKIWWYICAASVVFIVFCIPFYVDQRKPERENPIQHQSKTSANNLPVKPLVVKTDNPVPIKKKIASRPKKIAIPVLARDSAMRPLMVIDTIITAPTLATTATPSFSPKKKLQVVHINELQPEKTQQVQEWANQTKGKQKQGKTKNLIRSFVSNSASDKLFEIDISPSK